MGDTLPFLELYPQTCCQFFERFALKATLCALLISLALASCGDDTSDPVSSPTSTAEVVLQESVATSTPATVRADETPFERLPRGIIAGVSVNDVLADLTAAGLTCVGPFDSGEPGLLVWGCQSTVQSEPIEYTRDVTIGSQDVQTVSGFKATVFGWSYPWSPGGPDLAGVQRIEAAALTFLPFLAAVIVPGAGAPEAERFIADSISSRTYSQLLDDSGDYNLKRLIAGLDVYLSRDGIGWVLHAVPGGDETLPP